MDLQLKQLFLRHVVGGTLLALLLAACSSPSPTASTPTPLPAGLSRVVSGRVDVGGYELYYTCAGQGNPTVILEAGGPADSSYWELVRVYFGAATRVCAYDRANLGNSDKVPKPRTFQDLTRDLHALLVNAPIEGPYVLVGHSMGGMLVRVFADQFPDEVVGLVLVDSAHPDMGARLLAALPLATAGEPDSLQAWRQYGTWMSTSDGRGPNDLEGVDMTVSNEQVRAVKPLGDLPLVVISRSPDNPIMAAAMPSLPEDTNAQLMQLWQEMQAELEGLSSNSTRIIADHSGHNVHLEEPRLVVDAIRQVVNDYRIQAGITVPPGLSQTEATSHRPQILSIAERKERQNGALIIYEDFRFTDPAGDAITVVNNVISATLPGEIYDDIILASAEEQKQGALVTSRIGCYRQSTMVIEFRVADAAGNQSEPVTVTFPCPAPQTAIWPGLLVGLGIGGGVLVGAGLLVWAMRRQRHAGPAPA